MPDYSMNYLQTDAPAGITLADWRRSRLPVQRRRRSRLRIFLPAPRPAFA